MKNLFTKITFATAIALLGAGLFASAPAHAGDPTKKCGTVVADGDKGAVSGPTTDATKQNVAPGSQVDVNGTGKKPN